MLAQMVVKGEADLKKLIGAGALANAVTFGGCDYVGFHTAMAMLPALEMSRMLTDRRQPLPVLKVLYRNSQQIQSVGGASKATLEAIHAAEHASEGDVGIADPRRLPQGRRRAGREAAGRRGRLAARCIQRPAAGDAGRPERPPLCVCPSHLRAGRACWARSIRTRCCGSASGSAPITNGSASSTSIPSRRFARWCRSCSTSTSWPARSSASAIRAMPPSMNFAWRSTTARATKRPKPWRPRWPTGSTRKSSARRSRWPRTCTCCGRGRTSGGPTAIRPASIRPTPPTPGATWRGLPSRDTPSRA